MFILAFVCGVAALQVQAVLPSAGVLGSLALAALIGVAVSCRWSCRSRGRMLAGCAGAAVLGFAWAAGWAHWRLAEALPEAWEGQDVRLVGVIAGLPQRFEGGERFNFDVESVLTPGASVPGRVALSWYRRLDGEETEENSAAEDERRAVRPGERWQFTVRLKRPHGNANPGGFDYEVWLLERNIRATGSVRARAEARRLDAFVWRPGDLIERLRDAIRARFLRALPNAPYAGVLVALAVGDQRAISDTQWQVFNRTGITHLVSISGLHVTMVAALFAALVNELWRRSERLMLRLPAPKAALAAGWLAALAYALLAGFEVPAQRTLYMLSVLALALWSGRNLGVGRILRLALFAVLLLDPWAVLSVGTWLSFGAVALLLFVGRARVGRLAGWRGGLVQWGAAQWAVTFGSLPLLLFFFQQFSLVSPLANAIAIPLVSFVITPLALLCAAVPWSPLLSLDHALLAQLMRLVEWLAQWPVWQQAAPPPWSLVTALAGVIWFLLPRGFPARWLGFCLVLPALCWPPPRPRPGEVWADVLDVGQGLAVVVRTAAHTLLYDTGPAYGSANAGLRVVLPFLRTIGVARLDALVVSHQDKDHSGGLESIRAGLPIDRLLTSIPNVGGELCQAGHRWSWDGVDFAILHPEADAYRRPAQKSNNLSCVLRVGNGRTALLLPADIEAADEKALLARAAGALPSTVLLVPHHGGRGSSTAEFVAAVEARHAVFSAGYRNAFGHPRPDIIARYAASHTWRTDTEGAIRIVLSDTAEVSAWRHERRRYWQGR